MSMQQESWRDSYRRLAAQFIGADPRIGRADLADRLAVPENDLDWILGADWRDRHGRHEHGPQVISDFHKLHMCGLCERQMVHMCNI